MPISFVCLYMFKCDVCVCAQLYVDQIKKIFVLFTCFWKWFVSPMFFKVLQVDFVWKTCFLGVFASNFTSNLSHKFKTDCFATVSKVRLTNELPVKSFTSMAYQWVTCENSLLLAKISRLAI